MARSNRTRKPLPAGQSPPSEGPIGWRWLLLIFLVALAYRGACFLEVGGHPLLRRPVVDAGQHDAWAWRIVQGDRLGHSQDDVFKPPMYPYFLAGLYGAFGRHVAAVQWTQYVLGALSCVLLALLGGWLLGPWAGRVAGLLGALYAPLVFFESQLLTPAVSVFLNTAALLLVVRVWDRRGPGWLVAAGALLGVSAGVRADVILPAALVVLYLALQDRGISRLRRAVKVACVVAGGAAMILPVTLRNYRLTGQFIPISSNAGINLYVGNVAGDGTTAVPVGLRWERLVSRVPQETLERPADASRWWMRRTWEAVKASPWGAMGRLGRKSLAFFNRREFRNNICYHFLQREALTLRAPLLQYWMVLPLAFCGLVSLWRSHGTRQRRALALCLLWAGGYWLAGVLFFVTARFRVPAVPLLLLPAAWGLLRIAEAIRRRRGKALAAFACLILAVGGLAWPTWFGRPEKLWVRDYVNLGNSLRTAGQMPAAERAYRQALAHDAEDPDANYLLGRLLLPARPAAGVERLKAARRALGDSPDLLLAMGQGCLAAGRPAEARKALQELLDLAGRCNLWPKRDAWAQAHLMLAKLDPAAGEDHWRQAWRIHAPTAAEAAFLDGKDLPRVLEVFGTQARKSPWDWYAQANLGLVLLEMHRPADAVGPLRNAVRLAAGRGMVRFQLARALADTGKKDESLEILRRLSQDLSDGPLRRQVESLRAHLASGGK